MLELVDFPTSQGIRSLSPFGYKAEALVAMTGKDYRKIPPDPALMPHGKVPVLRDGDEIVPDSSLIQRHLEKYHGLAVDARLTSQERAVAEAFRRMSEEHLRWVLVYSRWIDPASEEVMISAAFGALPEEAGRKTVLDIRGQVTGYLHTQGLGRHAREDIYRFGADDLDAIAAWLDDKPFLMGDSPTSVDAAVVGVLYAILACASDTPLFAYARALQTLPAYVVRFERTVFGDKAKIPADLIGMAEIAA
jgi:glutathione S-transferase